MFKLCVEHLFSNLRPTFLATGESRGRSLQNLVLQTSLAVHILPKRELFLQLSQTPTTQRQFLVEEVVVVQFETCRCKLMFRDLVQGKAVALPPFCSDRGWMPQSPLRQPFAGWLRQWFLLIGSWPESEKRS